MSFEINQQNFSQNEVEGNEKRISDNTDLKFDFRDEGIIT